eukprot:GILI01001617.1.p1 GENE.GILI01001617.1~~GILI01001617.1.p1  ORF type:complete len:1102 (-),score=266.63 GILI01001617.1:47-3352(-)
MAKLLRIVCLFMAAAMISAPTFAGAVEGCTSYQNEVDCVHNQCNWATSATGSPSCVDKGNIPTITSTWNPTSTQTPCSYSSSETCNRNQKECTWVPASSGNGAGTCVPIPSTTTAPYTTSRTPTQASTTTSSRPTETTWITQTKPNEQPAQASTSWPSNQSSTTMPTNPCPYSSPETCSRNQKECAWVTASPGTQSEGQCVPINPPPSTSNRPPVTTWSTTPTNEQPPQTKPTEQPPQTSTSWARTTEPNRLTSTQPPGPPITTEAPVNMICPYALRESCAQDAKCVWNAEISKCVPVATTTARASGAPSSTSARLASSTAPPATCRPTIKPTLTVEATNNAIVSTTRWLRMMATVGSYFDCGRDVTSLVRVFWQVSSVDSLPSNAVTLGRGLAIPPLSIPAGPATITAVAVYGDNMELAASVKIKINFVSPVPMAAILGGSLTVGASQEFNLNSDVSLACTNVSNCNPDTGLVPYTCTSSAGCRQDVSWTCSASSGSCSSITDLLSQRRTSYTGLRLPVGVYTITLAVSSSASSSPITATKRIVVMDGMKPSVSVNCVGRFITERLICTATATRDLKITWFLNGALQSNTGLVAELYVSSTLSQTITASVVDAKGNSNNATTAVTLSSASLSCTKNVAAAVGMKTQVSVSCIVDSGSSTAQLTYSYRVGSTGGDETRLSPIPQPTGAVFNFTAPPTNTNIYVVASAIVDGKVIATSILDKIATSYIVSQDDISALQSRVSSATTDVTGTISAAATLSTLSQSAPTSQQAGIATAVIDAVSSIATSNSSGSLSDSETVMASSAVSYVVQTIVSSSDADGKAKAAAALAQLASVAAQKGTDGTRDDLLRAAAALPDSPNTKAIATQVAIAVMLAAPADGSVRGIGTGTVKVTAARFSSTDTGNRSVAIRGSSVTMPMNFSISGADDSTTAGLVARISNSADSASPAPSGSKFLSDITTFEAYLGEDKYTVRDQAPISIRIAASASTGDSTIVYLDETTGKWLSNGVSTTGRCSDSKDYVCGTTTHFTSFAVVSGSNGSDGDSSSLGLIVGVVIGGIVLIAVVAVVVVKMRKPAEARSQKDEEMAYAVPLSELSGSQLGFAKV